MKKLIILALFLSFFGCGGNENYDIKENSNNQSESEEIQNLESENINSNNRNTKNQILDLIKVKGGYTNCDVFEYRYKFGDVDYSQKSLAENHQYDINGNIIKKVEFFYDGSFANQTEYKYDKNENVTEILEYFEDLENIDWKYNFKYDINNNLIEKLQYNSIGLQSKFKYIYDDKSQIVQEVKFENYGATGYNIDYIYDNYGNMISKITTFNGRSGEIYDYEYDKERQSILVTWTENNRRTFVKSDNYKYDNNGNKIEKVTSGSRQQNAPSLMCKYVYSN